MILSGAVAFSIGEADPGEIDRLNILQASLLAMRRAVEGLSPPADFLYVDGSFPIPGEGPAWDSIRQEPLVRGDSRCLV